MCLVTLFCMANKLNIEVKWKFWLEINGKPAIGPGKFMLLDAINRTGSISAAARELGLSFKKAWLMIHELENALGKSIVESHRGGSEKGQSKLTDLGLDLLSYYKRMLEIASEFEKKINLNNI